MVYRVLLSKHLSISWADLDRMTLDDVDQLCIALDAWEDALATPPSTK